jgi:hypothetical protein
MCEYAYYNILIYYLHRLVLVYCYTFDAAKLLRMFKNKVIIGI